MNIFYMELVFQNGFHLYLQLLVRERNQFMQAMTFRHFRFQIKASQDIEISNTVDKRFLSNIYRNEGRIQDTSILMAKRRING